MLIKLSALPAMIAVNALLAGCASAGPAHCDKDYPALVESELAEVKAGEDVLRRIIHGELAEEVASPEEIAAIERMEAINDDRARPVDDKDLAILERAEEILASPEIWDREDDRKCNDTDVTISLFCALRLASIEILGEYEHRRTALQEVRFAIEEARPGVEYEHRLTGFNNAPDTSLEDVKAVLRRAAEKVRERLQLQARCAL